MKSLPLIEIFFSPEFCSKKGEVHDCAVVGGSSESRGALHMNWHKTMQPAAWTGSQQHPSPLRSSHHVSPLPQPFEV